MKFYIVITALLASFTANIFGMESKALAAEVDGAQQTALQQTKIQAKLEKGLEVYEHAKECGSAPCYQSAYSYFRACFKQELNLALKAQGLYHVGSIYQEINYLPQAQNYYQQALAVAKRDNYTAASYTMQQQALLQLAMIEYAKKNMVQAIWLLDAIKKLPKLTKETSFSDEHNKAATLLNQINEAYLMHPQQQHKSKAQAEQQAQDSEGFAVPLKPADAFYLANIKEYHENPGSDIVRVVLFLFSHMDSQIPQLKKAAHAALTDFNARINNALKEAAQDAAESASAARGAKRNEHPAAAPDDDEEDADEPGSTKEPAAKRARKNGMRDVSGKEAKKN